jgi:alcohol-forming fatty acyl-CoA reductase
LHNESHFFFSQSLVHVSTAYSNPYLRNVDEQVYGSTAAEDHQIFINGVGVLPDQFIDTVANRFQKKHPNTYTLTKQMAEQIVLDYHGKLPVCIVRPSIVTAANEEPYPGWIDNFCGITGLYHFFTQRIYQMNFIFYNDNYGITSRQFSMEFLTVQLN